MKSYLASLVPIEMIEGWHELLLKTALNVGSYWCEVSSHSPADTLRSVLESPRYYQSLGRSEAEQLKTARLCLSLGAPAEGVDLCRSEHPYNMWIRKLWGRRCYYYLSSLIAGLKSARRVKCSAAGGIADVLSKLDESTRSLQVFKRSWAPYIKPENTFTTRRDFANCMVSSLDPVLYSTLCVLKKARNGNIRIPDSTIKSILNEIRLEVEYLTIEGKGKRDSIVDESTLFWGFNEVVQTFGSNFRIGHYRDWHGATAVWENLMTADDGEPRFPSENEAFSESTHEIYGELRTRILILRNCINLIEVIPAKSIHRIQKTTKDYMSSHFSWVINEFAAMPHMCLLGLALDLSSNTLHAATVKKPSATACGDEQVFAYPNEQTNDVEAGGQVTPSKLRIFTDRPCIEMEGREISLAISHYAILCVLAENVGKKVSHIKHATVMADLVKKLTEFKDEHRKWFPSTTALDALRKQIRNMNDGLESAKPDTSSLSKLLRGFRERLISLELVTLLSAFPEPGELCLLKLKPDNIEFVASH